MNRYEDMRRYNVTLRLTSPPVRTAMSSKLALLLSPKPGALIAQTWIFWRTQYDERVHDNYQQHMRLYLWNSVVHYSKNKIPKWLLADLLP